MERFWSSIVHGLTPYVPGEQPKLTNLIKLNTNENPYGPSPKVLAGGEGGGGGYAPPVPGPELRPGQGGGGRLLWVDAPQVFVGNGSDEVLAFAFQALLKHPKPLLFPDITYSFYPVYCRVFEMNYETVPVTDDLDIRLEDYLRPNGASSFPIRMRRRAGLFPCRPSRLCWKKTPIPWSPLMRPTWISAVKPPCP